MELPQFNEERKLAERGVAIVKDIVENNLDWLFRKVPLEDDFGIDGYIDILYESKYVTGKSIGVQIKTGMSYFKNSTNSGWLFYGSNKHLNYYLNNPIPIIVVIVNPTTKECFWAQIDLNNVVKTESSWKIQINKSSILKNKDALNSVAGSFIDYAPQLEYMALVNEEVKKSGLIHIAIDKSEIKEKNYDGIHFLLKMFLATDDMIQKCRNKLMLTVSGYDNDTRELFEISEVRQWMKEAMYIFKYWGYFVCMDKGIRKHSTLKILLACTVHTKVKHRITSRRVVDVTYNNKEVVEFKSKIIEWLNEFTDTYNLPQKENFEQSMLIFQTINNTSDSDVQKMRTEYGFD